MLSILIILHIYPDINFYDDRFLYDIISIFVLLTVMITLRGKRKLLTALISFAGISLIDLIISGVVLLIFNINLELLTQKPLWDMAANSLSIIYISILILIKRKLKTNLSASYLSFKRRYLVVVLIGIIGCGWYIAPIQILGLTVQMSRYETLISIGASISGIAFILICVGLVIMKDSKMHYQNLSNMNEKLVNQQKIYYQTLIEKEEYTKRFRHDINNHIYCMQHLCEQKDYKELESYLIDMRAHVEKLHVEIETGNEIVNIIVNDIYAKSRNDNIIFKWSGILPNALKISLMDICTIFSNLMNNAVEAVRKIDNEGLRIIDANIKNINNSIVIEINNTIAEKVNIENQHLVTTKENKDKHGLGTMNVRECVKKYNGNLQYYCTDDKFTVSIVFWDIVND